MHMIRRQNAFAFVDNRTSMFVMLASVGTTEQMMTMLSEIGGEGF